MNVGWPSLPHKCGCARIVLFLIFSALFLTPTHNAAQTADVDKTLTSDVPIVHSGGKLFSSSIEAYQGGLQTRHASTSNDRAVESYGKSPLSFELNKGQTNSKVKFLSRGRGYGLFFTSNEVLLAIPGAKKSRRRLNPPHYTNVFSGTVAFSI